MKEIVFAENAHAQKNVNSKLNLTIVKKYAKNHLVMKGTTYVKKKFIYVIINVFIQIIYCDSFYLSNSYYAKINCNYDFYWSLANLFNSVLLVQAKFLTTPIFLVYNCLVGIVLFCYYINIIFLNYLFSFL